MQAQRVDVSPTTQPANAEPLRLSESQIQPMYREKISIDLETTVRVALARNIDVLQAREAVLASEGRLESAVGGALPVLAPTALFDHVEGTVRATEGNLVNVGFNTFQPSIAVQWAVNPGRVIYEIVAAKKRLLASEQQERGVILAALRLATLQFYDLVLAQARVDATFQSVSEAQELLRINRLKLQTGTGVLADELRAQARLAATRQDLALATQEFYDASVALGFTLRLDAAATLIPAMQELPPIRLVRDDLEIEEMLAIAAASRPELGTVRRLVEASEADKGSVWWGAFGPAFQVGYQYGGITGHSNNTQAPQGIPGNLLVNPASADGSFSANPLVNGLIKEGIARGSRRAQGRSDQTFGFSDQQRFNAGTGWRLSLSAFGDLKTASAEQRLAILEAERVLDLVHAEVVSAAQSSRTSAEVIDLARQQVASATEALRLSQSNLEAGTMTTLDVLQAQDAVAQARLSYADAVVEFNKSQIDLLASLGLLSAATLAPSPVAAELQQPHPFLVSPQPPETSESLGARSP
jgi:outer membrane protein TolC